MKKTSWVIVEIKSGRPVLETWSEKICERINTEKYKIVPIMEWLISLNQQLKQQ